MGQIAQDACFGGWPIPGGGINLIKAMPVFWDLLVRQPLPYTVRYLNELNELTVLTEQTEQTVTIVITEHLKKYDLILIHSVAT